MAESEKNNMGGLRGDAGQHGKNNSGVNYASCFIYTFWFIYPNKGTYWRANCVFPEAPFQIVNHALACLALMGPRRRQATGLGCVQLQSPLNRTILPHSSSLLARICSYCNVVGKKIRSTAKKFHPK
jgi:hypothetical protein